MDAKQLLIKTDIRAWSRSTSKDVRLALKVYEDLLSELTDDFWIGKKIGLYGGFCNGPLMYEFIDLQMASNIPQNFQTLQKNWPPRQHFKQSAPLKLAHLSFIKKFNGPLYCLTDPFNCITDAFKLAEMDLINGDIDYAIVVSGFSFEEPQLVHLYNKSFSTRTFYESSVACLLEKTTTEKSDCHLFQAKNNTFSYGYCTPLIVAPIDN